MNNEYIDYRQACTKHSHASIAFTHYSVVQNGFFDPDKHEIWIGGALPVPNVQTVLSPV